MQGISNKTGLILALALVVLVLYAGCGSSQVEKLSSLKKENDELKVQLTTLNNRIGELQEKLGAGSAELENVTKQLEQLKTENEALAKNNTELKGQNQLIEEKNTQLTEELKPKPSRKVGRYAIVVSSPTSDTWSAVVKALQEKYDETKVFTWSGSVNEVKDGLSSYQPKYTCFVCQWNEANKSFVQTVHQMTRELDSDPYGDTIWGILTGYDESDARRIAQYKGPLEVKYLLSGCGNQLDAFPEGVAFSELADCTVWEKKKGGPITSKKCEPDTSPLIAEEMNNNKADVIVTSGHAQENVWGVKYNGPGAGKARLTSRDGKLTMTDMDGKSYPITTDRPKAYIAAGNCLFGNISDRNCITLAWIHSGGVVQLVGYTVTTWYGFMGWGTWARFQSGKYSLAEAFHETNRVLVDELVKGTAKDVKGHNYDKDVVAFYGDPAVEVKIAK